MSNNGSDKLLTSNNNSHLNLKYIFAGKVSYKPREVLGERVLGDFEFVHILEGAPTYVRNGEKFQLKPGSIVCGRPGSTENYFWDTENITVHSFFHFQPRNIPKDLLPLDKWPTLIKSPSPLLQLNIQDLIDILLTGSNKATDKPSPSVDRKIAFLIDAFVNHKELNIPDPGFSSPVERAIKLMRSHLDTMNKQHLSLPHLAEAAHVSEKHLCRLFSKELGFSPLQTLRLMQMQFAVVLLSRTNFSMKQVAQRAGFEDPLYFSRYFVKTYGSPPSKVRQQIRAGEKPPTSPLPSSVTPIRFSVQ